MLGQTNSYATIGIDAIKISVETDVRGGQQPFAIVGLPSNTVKESKERVMSAIRNSGFRLIAASYTVNLAPADIRKEGASLDLPIALSLLVSLSNMSSKNLNQYAMIGELALDGSIRPVKGVLPIAIQAQKDKVAGLILPRENAEEAGIIEGLNVYPVSTLNEAVNFLEERITIEPVVVDKSKIFAILNEAPVDMFDVKGQYQVKRALEVAAAGGHNLLMLGPPGSGKTMLARRIPTILPDMTIEEALETTKIHSIAGLSMNLKNGIVTYRPFRAPHHTISDVALIGGGAYPKPGEVSLSHHGVLFLDELPEFKKNVLEVLRQPLEDGIVSIARAQQSLIFPAEFILIASMNPCPCGYYGNHIPGHSCNCPPPIIQRYRSRVSGPLLDRIDIHIEVPAVLFQELSAQPTGETSVTIRKRVNASRKIQLERFNEDKIYCNAQMNSKLIRKYCHLTKESQEIIRNAMDTMGFSARVYDRIQKVARTIADLEGSNEILPFHISEAVQYRSLDKKFWD